MVYLADKNPAVAGLTEDSFAIIFAGVRICYNKWWCCIFGALSRKAALAMSIPRNRTISRVWAQTDPLVTGRAENAVSLKLGYVRVRTKVLDTLLFGTLGASALGWWPGRVGLNRGRGARDGGVRMGFNGLCSWRSG